MQGYDFNVAVTIFYVFVSCASCPLPPHFSKPFSWTCQYILSDIPSNLILKRYGSIWLAFLVIGFGVVALGSAFVTSFAGLIVTRVFLGLAEGGTLVSDGPEGTSLLIWR